MAGIYHPSRGGVRGGQDQFKWEDVKNDKDKEYYIGHSLMVPTGQWTKGKDIFWYTRDKDGKSEAERTRAEEIRKVKELEARAMAAVLGKKTFTVENPLSKEEIKEVLTRGKTESNEASKIAGMGYKKTLHKESGSRYGTDFAGGEMRVHESERTTLGEKDNKRKGKEEKKRKHDHSNKSEEKPKDRIGSTKKYKPGKIEHSNDFGHRETESSKQHSKKSSYNGSRDEIRTSRENYKDSRDEIRSSRENYNDSRDEIRSSRENYNDSRDEIRSSRENYNDSRDEIRSSRENYNDSRDEIRSSRENYNDSRDKIKLSRERVSNSERRERKRSSPSCSRKYKKER